MKWKRLHEVFCRLRNGGHIKTWDFGKDRLREKCVACGKLSPGWNLTRDSTLD